MRSIQGSTLGRLEGLCSGMERGFLQLECSHSSGNGVSGCWLPGEEYFGCSSYLPDCSEMLKRGRKKGRTNIGRGEAGMAGAALCVCTCVTGCSWMVGKQYSLQRFLNWSDVLRMFIPEHLVWAAGL